MRKKILSIFVIVILTVLTASAQSTKGKKADLSGNWKFEAPYAPEGYTSGNISIVTKEKVPTATISLPGTEYKIPAQNVKLAGDSLQFEVYIDGSTVDILLKMETTASMSGKAIAPDGEIPLTLTREAEKK